MKYLLALVAILALAYSQDCNNPLLKGDDFYWTPKTGILDTPVKGKDLKICKPLEGNDVCCDASAFADLESKFNDMKETFKNKNGKWMDKGKRNADKFTNEKNVDEIAEERADVKAYKEIRDEDGGDVTPTLRSFLRMLPKKDGKSG